MRAPRVQRCALLLRPVVALIDSHDFCPAPGNMVQDSLGHLQA